MDAVDVLQPLLSKENKVGMISEHVLDICRFCLINNPMMRNLFHVDDVLSLANKAMSLTSVKISSEDGLPSHICCTCIDKLESSYKFKLQVEETDNILHQRLNSLNIKENLFTNNIDDNTCNYRHIKEISEEDLLLKDHTDLINIQNVNEREKQEKNNMKHQNLQKHENRKDNHNLNKKEANNIVLHKNLSQIHNDEQICNPENELQEISGEQHNHSFEAEVLHDIVLHEINNEERIQELNQVHHLTMYEHNYVAESHLCNRTNENSSLNSQELKEDNKKSIPNNLYNINLPEESSQSKVTGSVNNSRKILSNEDLNESNYFENLNLSSRLKVQSEKSEKIFFICYLCDKHFLSKKVLKEHMYFHEEVRKTLSFMKNEEKKLEKTSRNSENIDMNSTSLKSLSSGKHPNTCPHCGKEYLYIISYNKHLKQHEKGHIKEDIPLETSFHEDGNMPNWEEYNENTSSKCVRKENENQDKNKIEVKDEININDTIKCNTCEKEFHSIHKLNNHDVDHAIESIHTEQDLNAIQSKVQEKSIKIKKDNSNIDPVKFNKSLISMEVESRNLKCPHCSSIYSHKKSIARHTSSHGIKKYTCKFCNENFNEKEYLFQHTKEHTDGSKTFKCTQCNNIFDNELTLRSHIIATTHKTILYGKEYDLNKRVKRVAARAAQKIIDQIKIDLNLDDEFEENERKKLKDMDFNAEEAESFDEKNDDMGLNKLHNKSLKFSCATCNQKYVSKHALIKHMEQHVKDETLVKSEILKNNDKYQENQKKEDDDIDDDDFESGLDWLIDSYECFTCKKRYSTKKSLLRHQLLHEEPNFQCDICNTKFYRKDKLKAHYDKCSEKNPDQVRKCNICGDDFENNEILRKHKIKHVTEGILTEEDLQEIEPRPKENNEEKIPRKRRTDIVGLECRECKKRYTSRKGLLRHIQVHEGKKYLCDICPKKFYRREHLKIHMAKHNMIKPYKCPRCTKRFIKEEQLNTHLTKHDRSFKKLKETDTSKRFLCEICSKSFTQSTTLIAHLRVHNGIKPYVCEVCSRPFTTNAYLKMHMRTHTQEKPYVCQYCSRAFARADTLANHLTTHTGEAKYHCKYCPKNFRRLKSLKEHVFIHTGQRPYACPTCDRRFNNNGSRYAHSKRCKQNSLRIRDSSHNSSILKTSVERELEEQEQQELHDPFQSERLNETTIEQAQIIKQQSIKTFTITRPDARLHQSRVMGNQEILMPLILPLTVTLTDVGEEVILPEGTKIFTT